MVARKRYPTYQESWLGTKKGMCVRYSLPKGLASCPKDLST